MTGNSDPERSAKEIFEPLDEFIRQFDDRDIEVRPDPASSIQTRLAVDLSDLMTEYRNHQRSESGYALVGNRPSSAWTNRLEVALDLEEVIRDVKAQGMVHDGTQLKKKLTECQEDNRKLSLQVLEYKNRLGLHGSPAVSDSVMQ